MVALATVFGIFGRLGAAIEDAARGAGVGTDLGTVTGIDPFPRCNGGWLLLIA
jgi:hypothetical protein